MMTGLLNMQPKNANHDCQTNKKQENYDLYDNERFWTIVNWTYEENKTSKNKLYAEKE